MHKVPVLLCFLRVARGGGFAWTLAASLCLFSRVSLMAYGAVPSPPPLILASGSAHLRLVPTASSGFGLHIDAGPNAVFEQPSPVLISVVDAQSHETWLGGGYQTAKATSKAIVCVGNVQSAAGTRFRVRDTYAAADSSSGAFTLARVVTIEAPQAADKGFNSAFRLLPAAPSEMADNAFFAPGVWYGNSKLPPHALAARPEDHDLLFREDRLPLPLIAQRNGQTGATCLLAHLGGNPTTFAGENGRERIIDARLQFGAIGVERSDRPSPMFLFPGSEGERTYIRGPQDRGGGVWAYRSHPVQTGVPHAYRLLIRVSRSESFPDAVRDSWRLAYAQANPPAIRADLSKVYRDGMSLLDTICRPYQGVVGIPFAATVPQGEVVDPSSQMGFVGQALPSAALLLRYGYETKNSDTIARASAVVDYWAKNSPSPTGYGVPRTWYDVHPNGPVTWRNYHTFLRVASDGLEGVLQAWNVARRQGVDHPDWMAFCRTYGDFLVRVQNADGSWAREYDFTGAAVNPATDTTDQAIPYLADLYRATGDDRYRQAALRAGAFSLATVHDAYAYVGGTPDNPNVTDKEGGMMALAAFLALYDLSDPASADRPRYLAAAVRAATFSETWVYCWNIPIPEGDKGIIYPRNRTTFGLSLIATGHSGADNYMAAAPFFYYRLYVLTGDAHFREAARMLLYDTKQMTDWDGALAYRYPGLLTEALSLAVNRGHGVTHYLPWLTVAILLPMTQLQDVYGGMNMDAKETRSLSDLRQRDAAYSAEHGLIRATRPLPTP